MEGDWLLPDNNEGTLWRLRRSSGVLPPYSDRTSVYKQRRGAVLRRTHAIRASTRPLLRAFRGGSDRAANRRHPGRRTDRGVRGPLSATKGTATVRNDQGTFTASESEYEEDHSEALRGYLEHRPTDGWEVAIVGSGEIGEESSYTVTITNGRLTERAEFRLSPQVKETLAGEGAAPTEKAVSRQIAATIRGDTWAKIKERGDTPTSIVWLAHPD